MHGETCGAVRLSVGFVAALVGMLVMAASAWAVHGPGQRYDPSNTNIPYLAWNGEQVRLVKCDNAIDDETFDDADVRFEVEDWSGDPHFKPVVERNTVADFSPTGEHAGGFPPGNPAEDGCVRGSIVSLKPGLAVVKLVVAPDAGPRGDRVPVLKHQFLVIWMSLTNPTLVELDVPGVGDPGGTGEFRPVRGVFGEGLVRATVKGTFPLGGNFAGLIGGAEVDTITLPDQWAQLARLFAIDPLAESGDEGPGGGAAFRWDIHDDQLTTEGHFGPAPNVAPAC